MTGREALEEAIENMVRPGDVFLYGAEGHERACADRDAARAELESLRADRDLLRRWGKESAAYDGPGCSWYDLPISDRVIHRAAELAGL